MINSIDSCRTEHVNVPKLVCGRTAWIVRSKSGYGVQFHENGFAGMVSISDPRSDGDRILIEKL